jgi:hemoglobin
MSSLYERLGGRDAVRAAVDIFYEKVLADPILQEKFTNTDMNRQKAHQRAFLTYAFGGPNEYAGKDLREGHKHLNLKEEHFTAVAGHLQATLEELNVPQDLINEVMAIAASTHDDVLNL